MQVAAPKKSYFSRFQVKQRRRRLGKTDYAKRRKMLRQDTSSIQTQKIRFCVRITSTQVICQFIRAYINGDKIIASASSSELKKYNINFGLTNYTACYLTGMLCAKRGMKAFNLESTNVDELFDVEAEADGTMKCVLDIGLRRATKGARVFAAMKGCSDGGVFIPHSPDLFYKYGEENALRDRVLGKDLSEYMVSLRDNDTAKYKKQFGGYIAKGVEPEKIAGMVEKAIEGIDKDFERVKRESNFDYKSYGKQFMKGKKSREEKERDVKEKLEEEN